MKKIFFLLIVMISTTSFAVNEFSRCYLKDQALIQVNKNDTGETYVQLNAYKSMDLPFDVGSSLAEIGAIKPFEQVLSIGVFLPKCKFKNTQEFECTSPGNYEPYITSRYRDSDGFFHEKTRNFAMSIEATLKQMASGHELNMSFQSNEKYSYFRIPVYCEK